MTPIFVAVTQVNIEIVRLLISAGADVNAGMT
jgi:ankyrin repeat protein